MRFDCHEDLINNIIIDPNKKIFYIKDFLKPVHIVMAASLYNYGNWKIEFENNKYKTYAENMNYKNPLEIDTIDGNYHSKAIKLRENTSNEAQVNKILQIIKNVSNFSQSTLSALETIISELFDNFYDHAETGYPPICCVQEWRASNFLEIAIADKGIGIVKSLEEVIKNDFPNQNPCKIACFPEVSSKKEHHGGFGLYYTKEFIKENKGKMHLISGKFCYIIDANGEKDIINPKYRWNGTIIRLIINKKQEVLAEKFFNKMPPHLEGEEDEWLF